MASPFPGMDPYLEHPAIFPDFHDTLISYMREALNAVLPPPYYAGSTSRTWIEAAQRPIKPDVNVLRPMQSDNGGARSDDGGGVAVAQAVQTAEAVEVHAPDALRWEQVRQTFLEIYAEPGGERVVATIEVLSPANKTPGDHGRQPYVQKQWEALLSRVHLLEIDLLRGGVHTTAVPLDQAVARAGTFDYHVCVHRYDRLDDYLVYPILLHQRLPVFPVPLLHGDPAVPLDLQAVLDRVYDTGQYRRRVPYAARPPVPPLRPEQAAWAEQLLRGQGLMPAPAAP